MFEVIWENKDPEVAKIRIKKKSRKTLPLRYKDTSQAIIIKTVQYWHKNKQTKRT